MFELGLTSLPAQLAGIFGLGVFMAYWFGYGATWWLVPKTWLPYRWFLMPAVGLTMFAVIAQPLALVGINSGTLAAILFPLALIANAAAFWKARHKVPPLPLLEWVVPMGIAAGAVILGVLPFFAYGYLTVLGYNVDGSTYVAQAEFAKQFGLNREQLAQIQSPYTQTVVHIITVGVGAAGPLWHSVLSQVMMRDAFYSYTPVLVLWQGFSLLSAYVLVRVTFRLRFWTSILVLAMLALNAGLWGVPLDNFALHTFALALLPLTWMTTAAFLETRELRTLILAGLSVAALLLVYPEATPFYFVPVALYLALTLVRERRVPWRELGRWGMIALVSLVLVPTAYWTLYAAAAHQSQTLARGRSGTIATFISPPEGAGLDALTVLEHEGKAPWESAAQGVWGTAGWLLTVVLGLCALIGLYESWRSDRRLLLASVVGMGAILAWMLFVQKYPYAFYKSWVTGLSVFAAICALGIQVLGDKLRDRGWTAGAAFVTGAIVLLLLVGEGASMIGFEKMLAERPPVVTRKLIQLANSRVIPKEASVYLSLTQTPNPRMYWAAYLLRERKLVGSGVVAYSSLHNAERGVIYDYALLNREENPVEFDYAPDAIAWDDRWTVLYRK